MADLSPVNRADALASLRQSLEQLVRWGCRGLACSEDSLAKVRSWSPSGERLPRQDSLPAIRSDMGDCRRCNPHAERRHRLFGEGDPHARLMIVCEGPAGEDDRSGYFYTGPAGELLLRMIQAMKLTPEQIYITCPVKCRPSNDASTASSSQIRSCLTFLKRQIEIIRPEVVCAMGERAAQSLLGRSESIEALRGRFYDDHQTRIMPTLDPAHLIRHPESKGRVWEDLKKIMAHLGIEF